MRIVTKIYLLIIIFGLMIKLNPVFESDRISFFEFHSTDASDFYDMNLDPSVLQFTGDAPFESIESAQEFIKTYDHYQTHGFGRWTIRLKENNVYLGFCGLKYSSTKNEIDLGFRLKQKFWGNGLGTEAAKTALDWGMESHDRIVGRAQKANFASIRILQKIGMQFQYDFKENDKVWSQFEYVKIRK